VVAVDAHRSRRSRRELGRSDGLDWDDDLEKAPPPNATFAELPRLRRIPKTTRHGIATSFLAVPHAEAWSCSTVRRLTKLSKPGESERDFRIRCSRRPRSARRQADELKKKYAPKLAALGERKRKAEQAVDREKGQAQQQTFAKPRSRWGPPARRIPGTKNSQHGDAEQSARP